MGRELWNPKKSLKRRKDELSKTNFQSLFLTFFSLKLNFFCGLELKVSNGINKLFVEIGLVEHFNFANFLTTLCIILILLLVQLISRLDSL